jgi:hypothetical protein
MTKVIQMDLKTKKIIKVWDSIKEAATYLSEKNNCNINSVASGISGCIRGKQNTCQGFLWERAEKVIC